MEEIGIIGLGLLGSAIAERLITAGFAVVGYDIDERRRDEGRASGVIPADSARTVATRCERLFLSLPNSAIGANVLRQIEDGLRNGSVVLDTTTGDPDDAAGFVGQLRRRAAVYLETNVGGSSRQVREHNAIVICGGDAEAYLRCADLLAAISCQSFFMGPAGGGNRMKLVLNLVLGLNRAALAEGLAFARANGIDAASALVVLRTGPAYSRVMDTKGGKMIGHDFEAEARLSQHLKDVRLILRQGEKCGAKLPLSRVHGKLLEELETAGYGDEDNSAIFRAFQKASE
jgi:3-hydroxyisobutyrate dehydrogenase-like beta-hydroxyacid dehydrogenase